LAKKEYFVDRAFVKRFNTNSSNIFKKPGEAL